MKERNEMLEKEASTKVCPFLFPAKLNISISCIGKRCMAWKEIEDNSLLGYCKLIERGKL